MVQSLRMSRSFTVKFLITTTFQRTLRSAFHPQCSAVAADSGSRLSKSHASSAPKTHKDRTGQPEGGREEEMGGRFFLLSTSSRALRIQWERWQRKASLSRFLSVPVSLPHAPRARHIACKQAESFEEGSVLLQPLAPPAWREVTRGYVSEPRQLTASPLQG